MTRWAPIAGFEGRYLVSDSGQVKRLAGPGRGNPNRDKILKLGRGTQGYVQVLLYPGGGAKPTARRVHQLVLEAFVCSRPAGSFGLHADDNRLNNHVSNLRWGDRSENTADAVRNGRHNHARKQECKWGHQLSGDNLRITPKQRVCRACEKRRRDEYEQRKALAVYVADTQEVAA